MRSVDDLSTRSRIRDSAIGRFAREGFRASVRTIAEDAGVSPGLVIHHFGSKERLRAECDEHVLALIAELKQDAVATAGTRPATTSAANPILGLIDLPGDQAILIGYCVRSLQAGGDLARGFVDRMVADAIGYLDAAVAAGLVVPSRNEEARARYLVESTLGGMLLTLTLRPSTDPHDLTATIRRYLDEVAVPVLELYTESLFTTRQLLDDYLHLSASRRNDDDPAGD